MATPDINTMAVNPARPNQRHNLIITDFFLNYDEVAQVPGLKAAIPGTTPGGPGVNANIGLDESYEKEKPISNAMKCCIRNTNSITRLFQEKFGIVNFHHFMFLALLGIITSLVAFIVDLIAFNAIDSIVKLSICNNQEYNYYLRFAVYVGFSLVFMLIAASIGCSAFISSEAEGSGVPEIKAIIAGIDIYKYLSLQTCIGKMIGLIAGLIGGLPIGREGPFIHMSACVASKLSKFKCFEDIEKNQALKRTMYSAAVAAGMTAAFGAPFGAIMFSIEVSTTYYMVSNLFKEFFCVTFSIIVYKVFEMLGWLQIYKPTAYPMKIVVNHEVFLFAILGIICGLIGAISIQIMTRIIFLRTRLKIPILSDRWKWCIGVGLTCGLMKFPVHFMMASDYKILNHMFATQDLDNNKDGDIWSHPNTPFNLSVYCILKFILIMLATCSPIPAGVLTPSFILGAVFGRLYGFVIKNIGISIGVKLIEHEGVYAIVGAAALGGAVTRTVSIAMIVFEIIGQTSHMIPLLVGTLMAYAVSNSISLSVYDALLEIKNLPFLPTLSGVNTYSLTARDLMNENFLYLTQDSKISDIAIIVNQVGFRPATIPVVQASNKKTLLFTLQAQNLRKYLFRIYKQSSKKMDVEVQALLNQYFYSLNCINQQQDSQTREFVVDPLINQKEFQIQQLSIIHRSRSQPRANREGSSILLNDDFEGFDQARRLERQQSSIESFWKTPINFDDPSLAKDNAPFIVMEDTPMSKLHFLFIMLNISQVNVVKKGSITGIITKIEFVKKRKEEQKIKRKEQRNQKRLAGILYTDSNINPSMKQETLGLLDKPAVTPTETAKGVHLEQIHEDKKEEKQELLEEEQKKEENEKL